jgi:hypothetical protein
MQELNHQAEQTPGRDIKVVDWPRGGKIIIIDEN